MQVKTRFVFLSIGMMMVLMGCGRGYGDLVKVNTEYVNAMEEYVAGMEKASSSMEMAKAINRYADKMETLAPKLKEIRNKYPELENPQRVPDELKSAREKGGSHATENDCRFHEHDEIHDGPGSAGGPSEVAEGHDRHAIGCSSCTDR